MFQQELLIFLTATTMPLTAFLTAGSDNFILSVAQVRSVELSLTFPFPLHLLCQVLECTQNLTISSHVVLPLASEAPTFLVWIYWKSL